MKKSTNLIKVPVPKTEEEILEHRRLMKFEATQVYGQMGISVRAAESAKRALMWIAQMADFVTQESEVKELRRIARQAAKFSKEMDAFKTSKIQQAAQMEASLDQVRRTSAQQLIAIQEERRKKARREKLTPVPPPNATTDLAEDAPIIITDKAVIFELAAKEIAEKEEQKHQTNLQEPKDEEE